MELIKVEENALTVELSWSDCNLLAHLCRHALRYDALGDAPSFPLADGYARSLVALLEVGGMASWAESRLGDGFTIEHFRGVTPLRIPGPVPAD